VIIKDVRVTLLRMPWAGQSAQARLSALGRSLSSRSKRLPGSSAWATSCRSAAGLKPCRLPAGADRAPDPRQRRHPDRSHMARPVPGHLYGGSNGGCHNSPIDGGHRPVGRTRQESRSTIAPPLGKLPERDPDLWQWLLARYGGGRDGPKSPGVCGRRHEGDQDAGRAHQRPIRQIVVIMVCRLRHSAS
jgi:hypothetical protein